MSDELTPTDDQIAPAPIGSEGARLKQDITSEKSEKKTEAVDLGASMLGTDNEAGAMPDHDAMKEARNAPPPA